MLLIAIICRNYIKFQKKIFLKSEPKKSNLNFSLLNCEIKFRLDH